jgi:hypothetical protein
VVEGGPMMEDPDPLSPAFSITFSKSTIDRERLGAITGLCVRIKSIALIPFTGVDPIFGESRGSVTTVPLRVKNSIALTPLAPIGVEIDGELESGTANFESDL